MEQIIERAIKCGPVPVIRDWRSIDPRQYTKAEKVMAFAEHYLKVPGGSHTGKRLKLIAFQEAFIYAVFDNPHGTRNAILSVARRNSKALALNTPIATPDGFVPIGDLAVGDTVYSDTGVECKVVAKSPVFQQHDCFEVSFRDGSTIIADAGHLWHVHRNGSRNKGPFVKTTQELYDFGVYGNPNSCHYNWAVSVAGAITGVERNLLIDPYTLGVWLGDGTSIRAEITLNADDADHIVSRIKTPIYLSKAANERGTALLYRLSDGTRNVHRDCMQKDLRALNLLGNKHIPKEYLWSSVEQRMELLRGLMDTDGSVSKDGQCVISLCDYDLVVDVLQLVRSLGMKATLREYEAKIDGVVVSDAYNVQFWGYSHNPVTTLPRKVARLRARPERSPNFRNSIVAITPHASVETQCIQVNSESSLYLAGEAFTVTHNSFLTAVLLLAYLIGPLAKRNSTVASAANSRDQAALIAKQMFDMILMSDDLHEYVRTQITAKRAIGLKVNTEYYAMSSDARTGLGRSLRCIVLDESGQIKGPDNTFVSMLRTSQGSYDDPLFVTISTQAPSDADYLSIMIDDAIRTQDQHTVCHVYETPKEFDLLDEEGWILSNPGLDIFRSRVDLREQLKQASRIPAMAAGAENLLLNRRVALEGLWLAPHVWKENGTPIINSLFSDSSRFVALGVDLSARQDLTAAVFAVQDDLDHVHLLPYCFVPAKGIEEKAQRDRVPYPLWITQGHLIAVPGATIEYKWVAEFLKRETEKLGITVDVLSFDPWRIDVFKTACAEVGFSPVVWLSVIQGYKSMSPRVEAFQSLMLENRIHHGNHPLLTMAASNAVVIQDAAGNSKLDKSKSFQRIDPLVAAVMAAYEVSDGVQESATSIYETCSVVM